MIETDDFTSIQYVIDLDSKQFGLIEDIFTGVIPSMRQYGLNVYVSDIRPNKSYTEDRQLIVKAQVESRTDTCSGRSTKKTGNHCSGP